MMMKHIWTLLKHPASSLLLASLGCTALASPALKQQSISYRIDDQTIRLPNDSPAINILGLHGLVNFTPNWYAGMGAYATLSGRSGGYFALSMDAGYQHPIYQQLWLNVTGIFGAGGGRSTPVGGGLYVNPQAGLSWHFPQFNLGLSYSWLKYTSGQINSHGILFSLDIPSEINIAPYHDAGNWLTLTPKMRQALARKYISLLGQVYWPSKKSIDTHGRPNAERTEFVGAEYGQFFSAYGFWFVNMTGAFHGRSNGYANGLIGAGLQLPLTTKGRLRLNAKLAIGSGGGGDIDTGGGLLLSPTLGLEYQISQHYALALSAGMLRTPQGHFNSLLLTSALKYYLTPSTHEPRYQLQGWRIRVSHETYFKPRARDGEINPNMQLLNLNIDYRFNPYVYLSGQTAFAYHGQHTGGYFSGLVGPGLQYALTQRMGLFAELLGGTAGGAGLSIGNGAMWQADAGFRCSITPSTALNVSVGKLSALRGQFKSTVLNVGLGYRFASL